MKLTTITKGKKVLYIFLVLLIFSYGIFGQFAVTDPAAEASLANIQATQQIQQSYSRMQLQIASNDLTQNTSTTANTLQQITYLQKIYDAVQGLSKLQNVKRFFTAQTQMLQTVSNVSGSLNVGGLSYMDSKTRGQVNDDMNKAITEIKDSYSVASQAFSTDKLTITDRVNFIDKATSILSNANTYLNQAISLVNGKNAIYTNVANNRAFTKALFTF